MLTERRTSLLGDRSSFLSFGTLFDADRRVGRLGLEAAWLELNAEGGLLIFDGVRRAVLDAAGGNRDGDSDEPDGARILETGN